MKFTLGLPKHHPFVGELATGRFFRELATRAEAAGFDALDLTEHPIPDDAWLASGGHDAMDPLIGLAFAAAATTRLRLLSNLVVLPYRNPFLLAKTVATLDRLSEGRVILGVGVGYLKGEYDALGVPFEARNDRFDEALAVCRMAWTGKSVRVSGGTFAAAGNTALPSTVQDPLPVWIGGNAAITLRRVAANAQGWMPLLNPPEYARKRRTAPLSSLDDMSRLLSTIRGLRRAAGRENEVLDVVWRDPGDPFAAGWDLSAYMDGLQVQKETGVTWNAIRCDSASPDEVLRFVDRFGEVIAQWRGRALA